MKFKNALSLKFSFMFAAIILILFIGIYILVEHNRSSSFFTKLDERALIAGQFYFAEDNLSTHSFKQVTKKFPQSLSGESISIYDEDLKPTFLASDSMNWDKNILNQILKKRSIHFVEGNYQVSGLYFEDNSGNFLIVVSAIDERGFSDMKQLRLIMGVFFIVAVFVTFFIGRIFAHISLQPLVKMTNNLKLIRSSNLHMRLPIDPSKTDEIDKLSITINQVLENLEQSFDNQQAFVANASHELRTPITAILGEAEITLMKDREPEEYKLVLEEIVFSTKKLNLIINSLMELMQTSLNNKDFQQVIVDELMWEIIDELPEKKDKDAIQIRYDMPEDIHKRIILGNRRLLFIAISNVLKNALKFSKGKAVNCTVSYKNNGIEFNIEDQGIGIATEDLAKVFQPFFRSSNAMHYKGYGIGLSLASNIVKLHNGKINIHSILEKGTQVTLFFPRT